MRNILLATGAVFALATGASAATVLLDDFDVDQSVFDNPAGGQVNTSTINAGNLGGTRELTVDANVAPGAQLGASVIIENGSINFNNDNSVASDVELTYGNFGTFDLTQGGLGTGFIYEGVNTDNGFEFDVVVTDAGGMTSQFRTIVPGNIGDLDLFRSFDEFTGSADLTQVTMIEFDVASNGEEDASLDSVGISVVPVPASGLLLLGGLAGAAAVARKRKSA